MALGTHLRNRGASNEKYAECQLAATGHPIGFDKTAPRAPGPPQPLSDSVSLPDPFSLSLSCFLMLGLALCMITCSADPTATCILVPSFSSCNVPFVAISLSMKRESDGFVPCKRTVIHNNFISMLKEPGQCLQRSTKTHDGVFPLAPPMTTCHAPSSSHELIILSIQLSSNADPAARLSCHLGRREPAGKKKTTGRKRKSGLYALQRLD
jgi:hypothetical protein